METETERLKKIEASLSRIERGMFGDEELGQFGLVSRMNNHASRIKSLEVWVFRIGAGALASGAVVGIIYRLATDWLKRG